MSFVEDDDPADVATGTTTRRRTSTSQTVVCGSSRSFAPGDTLLTNTPDVRHREAGAVTFLVAASGLSFAGISPAFWALVAGRVVLMALRLRAR